jgi:3'(2'), 5'-bisphosphate nucleotidase
VIDRSLIETLVDIAAAAGHVVLEVYRSDFRVEYKGPGDPVTAADRRANALLLGRLREVFPGVPVIAEESDRTTYERFWEAERMLFVDPLDGTREFIDRNDEFAVMIGLVEGSRAAMGVVHAPATGVTWAGAAGLGSWQVDADSRWTPVGVSVTDLLARTRIVVSRSHRSPRLERALAALAPGEIRAMGSAGLKGAEVARGAADAYVDTGTKTKRWDACAVDALVTAAGGRVSDTAGAPIDYRTRSLANERGLVVSNGRVHDAIVTRLQSAAAHRREDDAGRSNRA